MKTKWESETELANGVVVYLKAEGWTVYPELDDIDIIATKPDPGAPNGLSIIGIETKKHFNLTVLNQADRKRRYVDKMYVAVSEGWTDNESFGCQIAGMFGLGVFFVRKSSCWQFEGPQFKITVDLRVEAALAPRKYFSIDELLHPEAQNYVEPGKKGGAAWTRFKKTVFELRAYVKENPGCFLKDALIHVPHHYSSYNNARSGIRTRIREGIITELVIKKGRLFLPE